jgi:hypothetical protein
MLRSLSIFALVACSTFAFGARAAGGFDKLYASIRSDPSFKVRLQAIRVLVKQLKSGITAEDRVFEVLGEAAKLDEEHLVRGLACYALGELGDPRGKPRLEAAKKDQHAFVRAQAEEALKLIEKNLAVAEQPDLPRSVLAFALDDSPGIEAPREVFDSLARHLSDEVRAQGSSRFTVSEAPGGSAGFRFGGSIAQLLVEPDGSGANRVTVVVRIAITTVPENHLRHVMTAKASAATKSSGAALDGLRDKVLKAAVTRAVKDSLAAVDIQ